MGNHCVLLFGMQPAHAWSGASLPNSAGLPSAAVSELLLSARHTSRSWLRGTRPSSERQAQGTVLLVLGSRRELGQRWARADCLNS